MRDDVLQAWTDFLRFHAQVTDVLEAELEAEVGMPLTWYDVLIQLWGAPEGRLRMQELAAAVVLSKSGLTRLVDRMERAGLVARRAHPSDRRGTLAEITALGRTRLRAAMPIHTRGIMEHFAAHLTDAQVTALSGAFAALVAATELRSPGQECARADTSGASPGPSA
ncbi:MAG: MarR family winged helix-turn-helix transcriptional regulator [Acidimicrobiales bacterium]